jgi:hypothetical protein
MNTAQRRRARSIVLSLAAAVVVVAAGSAAADAADHTCTYPTGKQSPQVRDLSTHGLTCKSARKAISAVRGADDWSGAYFGDTWGYVSYPTGGYDSDGYLNEREFRCTYELRGLTSKYVLVNCKDTHKKHLTVFATFHGR